MGKVSFITMLLVLAFAALAVRFTILGAMVSKRGGRIMMLALLGALITFDCIEFIARFFHNHS